MCRLDLSNWWFVPVFESHKKIAPPYFLSFLNDTSHEPHHTSPIDMNRNLYSGKAHVSYIPLDDIYPFSRCFAYRRSANSSWNGLHVEEEYVYSFIFKKNKVHLKISEAHSPTPRFVTIKFENKVNFTWNIFFL